MFKTSDRNADRKARHARVRKKISGTPEMPRLCVYRSLVNNMVIGVTEGFAKTLVLVGTGYRAQAEGGKKLTINIGFSHPVVLEAPENVTFETPEQTKIVVKGINKQVVGNLAADIRAIRKPEPYLGKGIKYEDEVIRRKEGKTGK